MSEIFSFDDFFVSEDDPGNLVELKIGARVVPIYFKRGLSLSDIEESRSYAVKTRVNPFKNTIELVSVDETEFTVQILVRAIKSWPFTYADGSPVPITVKSIRQLMAEGAEVLQQEVLKLINRHKEELVPFEKASDEA